MPRTLIAIIRAAYLELRFGLRAVAYEVDGWRRAARTIPDHPLREDALGALTRKRANIDGAALFWTLPDHRSLDLLGLLAAFEILADYMDCVSERTPNTRNGQQLHRALRDALDEALPASDYYWCNPWHDDAGYARMLVDRCRQGIAALPSNKQVLRQLKRAGQILKVLALNHDPDARRRDERLSAWAKTQFPQGEPLAWFELAAAASAWLPVLAMVAYGAEPEGNPETADTIFSAYMPWISLAGTMLDSYGDIDEDRDSAEHSYVAHYPPGQADGRIGALVRRAIVEASLLPNGARHGAIASCMIAMYLSKDGSRAPARIAATRQLACDAGPLQRILVPVLRAWRIVYAQTSDRAESRRAHASSAATTKPAYRPPAASIPERYRHRAAPARQQDRHSAPEHEPAAPDSECTPFF